MSVRLNPETGEPLPIEQQEFYSPPAQTSGAGPTTEPILQFFDKSVLYVGAPNAQPVLTVINDVAHLLVETLPRNPERTVVLRKLLEAKDAVIRTAITK